MNCFTQQCRELLHTHTAMLRMFTQSNVRALGYEAKVHCESGSCWPASHRPPGHHLQMRPNARIVPLGGPRPASPALKVENGGDDLVHKWWHCSVCILPNSTRGTGAPGQLKGSHQEVQSSELWEADGSTEPHIGASSTHVFISTSAASRLTRRC